MALESLFPFEEMSEVGLRSEVRLLGPEMETGVGLLRKSDEGLLEVGESVVEAAVVRKKKRHAIVE